MQKLNSQKGFTFIEVIVTLLLFTILLSILWTFFSNAFSTYTEFDRETELNDQARTLSSFIRDEIRSSEKVKISVVSPTDASMELAIYPLTTGANAKIEGQLKEIKLYNETTNAAIGIRNTSRCIRLEQITPPAIDTGDFKLVYEASGTPSLISDKIGNIKVIREENSPTVRFECVLQRTGETDKRLKIENIFSESLAYKEACTP